MRYLFAGPTLPDVRDLVDGNAVRLLPPVAAGDLLGLPLAEGDVVGVIDGYFHQRMAVRHKEIFAALAGGVRVLGASSIGALRAAEMDRYGMEGVGQIYADYRAGLVVGDDEVALLHGPAEAGYPAFSQPLVNIRATLAAAVCEAVIEEDEGDRLIGVLATMPYQRRDYEVLGNLAGELGIERKKGAALVAFCREHAVDLKRRDALLLLDRLNEPPGQVTPRPRLSRTQMLANWELAARQDIASRWRHPDGPCVLAPCLPVVRRGLPGVPSTARLHHDHRRMCPGMPGISRGQPRAAGSGGPWAASPLLHGEPAPAGPRLPDAVDDRERAVDTDAGGTPCHLHRPQLPRGGGGDAPGGGSAGTGDVAGP
ncbi:TfuA-like protein [Actinomadura madurae]|uniref:TfuA-like protein n=1 Tax=Actinomadura madurae TaxID=1993 RepID=UPI0020D21DEA|nr:TfuA-like protein [Actinomadura madurae]MCP9984171.1 TfuA-like protein [Actinomadura madurae]